MIKPHQFIALAALSAVSLAATIGLYAASNTWSEGKVEGAGLVPDLARNINSVAAVEVTQGGKILTIERAGNSWKVRDRAGYPAKPEVARTLLVALAQSKLVEPKTAAKDKHALLELDDPAGKDSKGRRVRVLDAGGKPLVDVVVGKSRIDAFGASKGGTYVRRANEDQTWLATGDMRAPSELRGWVDTKVFTSDTAKASKVTLEIPGEEPLVIERVPPEAADAKAPPKGPPGSARDPKFRLAVMPAGKKLKAAASIDGIPEAFGSFDLEDVRKLAETPSGAGVTTAKFETEGGPAVTFRFRKDGEAHWVSLTAAGAEGDAKTAADALNAKAQGWEFKIPSWKVEQIAKKRADLLEDGAS